MTSMNNFFTNVQGNEEVTPTSFDTNMDIQDKRTDLIIDIWAIVLVTLVIAIIFKELK